MQVEANQKVIKQLVEQKAQTLYALYDAAQDNSLLADLQWDNISHDCLFAGTKEISLRNVAPYLFSCQRFQEKPQDFISKIWQRGVSMLIESTASAEQIKLQLKKNAYVKNSDGITCYFRYYDARAFSRFMRVANTPQLSQLFGSAIKTIYWQDATNENMLALTKKTAGFLDRILDPGTADFDITHLS